MKDPRRRFTRSQRNRLFIEAAGKCTNCGEPLARGWHADHVSPWSASGITTLQNGAALCPTCNLKKGTGRYDGA